MRPIKNVHKQLQIIIDDIDKDAGDLTKRIRCGNKDEIGSLVLGINTFIERLQLVMKKVQEARAGEAGKGFSVVAEEIRGLAESSRATANNIQDISLVVIDGVKKLVLDATRMLEFVDGTILDDYDNFVNTAVQYSDDAISINGLLEDFASNASALEATISEMNIGINEISTTIDESAKGITNAASGTSDLVSAIERIDGHSKENLDIGKSLKEVVQVFKQI